MYCVREWQGGVGGAQGGRLNQTAGVADGWGKVQRHRCYYAQYVRQHGHGACTTELCAAYVRLFARRWFDTRSQRRTCETESGRETDGVVRAREMQYLRSGHAGGRTALEVRENLSVLLY